MPIRHSAHCRHCDRDLYTTSNLAEQVMYIRCSQCGTPVPPEGSVDSSDSQRPGSG